MGLVDSQGPSSSETPPPRWRTVDGADIPLESLENDPLPDGTNPEDIKTLQDLVRSLARELRVTRERLEQELKHRYGRRSEKRRRGDGKGAGEKPGGSEPGTANDGGATSTGSTTDTNPKRTPSGDSGKKPGHGRRPIPPDLPKAVVDIPLGDELCSECGGPTHHLEYVESYRFDYVPGYIRVVVLRRSKRTCDDSTCTGPFKIAKLPPEPIPKGRATARFLAHVLVTKFADHCPLYRFRKILRRQGVDLPLSTLVDYCKKSTELLKPLWELMRQRILEGDIIQTDDTHVTVRLPRKKGVLKGHLWAYKGGAGHPYVVFEFTPNWEAKAPQAFLAEFEGYVHADGYKGYDKLFEKDEEGNAIRLEVGCWAHARRMWVKAEASSPQVAREALKFIGELYAIEAECKDHSPEQRRAERKARAAPVLDKFYAWMEDQKTRVLPKSLVAAAIEYAFNQRAALARYLEDGRLAIDNNEIERELRAVALGRKNWMAAGSEVGGDTAAIGFTMISSALACGVNPVEWLADVLQRIVTSPADRLHELLPDRWKAVRDAARQAHEAGALHRNQETSSTRDESAADGDRVPRQRADAAAAPSGSSPQPVASDGSPVATHPEERGGATRRRDEAPAAGQFTPPTTTVDADGPAIESHESDKGATPTARAPP